MNRKERRKSGDRSRVKTYTLTSDQIKDLQKSAVDEAANLVLVKLMGLSVLALRDSFGFGKKRLERFTDNFLVKLQGYEDGDFTLEELYQVIYEETGVRFEGQGLPKKY